MENLKKLKYYIYWFTVSKIHEYEKIFKEQKSMEIPKILGSINNVEEYQKIYNHDWRKHETKI